MRQLRRPVVCSVLSKADLGRAQPGTADAAQVVGKVVSTYGLLQAHVYRVRPWSRAACTACGGVRRTRDQDGRVQQPRVCFDKTRVLGDVAEGVFSFMRKE